MNANYRQTLLLDIVDKHQYIKTSDLVALLESSPATIRRDINQLAEQGKLKKVRNGAQSVNQNGSKPLKLIKDINNFDEKLRIAKAASSLCSDYQSIILACGTTMMMLGEHLIERNLQIITNFLPLANKLIENNFENVVILGGQYNKNQAITCSPHSFDHYAADIFFTSGKGLSVEGLYKNDMLIATAEQQMINKAQKTIVLLDSSKVGKRVGMLFASLDKIDLLITGKNADSDVIEQLRSQGLQIMLV